MRSETIIRISNSIWISKKREEKKSELKDILDYSINQEIETIVGTIDTCISNDDQNVDIQDVEYYYPEWDPKIYIKNYKKLLWQIRNMLIKYQEKITTEHKSEMLKIMYEIRDKKELEPDQIIIFLEFLLKDINNININNLIPDDFIEACLENENQRDWIKIIRDILINEKI